MPLSGEAIRLMNYIDDVAVTLRRILSTIPTLTAILPKRTPTPRPNEVQPATSWDKSNDFANIQVDLADGRHYGINVWTFQFLATSIDQDRNEKSNAERQEKRKISFQNNLSFYYATFEK